MNNSHLINPFSLLDITEDSTLNELKKKYYGMSLLCHPDKGGNSNDMYIVNSAYKYIKNQLINKNNKETTYEKLEDDFELFCRQQEDETPTFNQIFEETNDWVHEFNRKFEEGLNLNTDDNHDNINSYNTNSFDLNH